MFQLRGYFSHNSCIGRFVRSRYRDIYYTRYFTICNKKEEPAILCILKGRKGAMIFSCNQCRNTVSRWLIELLKEFIEIYLLGNVSVATGAVRDNSFSSHLQGIPSADVTICRKKLKISEKNAFYLSLFTSLDGPAQRAKATRADFSSHFYPAIRPCRKVLRNPSLLHRKKYLAQLFIGAVCAITRGYV